MIKLDEHRKANLEMMFQHATDRDLLHELVRRGRFHQMQASALFWPEMRDQPGYMEAVQKRVLYLVAKGFADTDIRPAFLQEREYPHAALDKDFKIDESEGQPFAKQSVLTADVIVLCARTKDG